MRRQVLVRLLLALIAVSPVALSAPAVTEAVNTEEPWPQQAVRGVQATSEKPNIVVFHIDDAAPHDGRLWNNPDLTPTIYDLFVANGFNLPNAVGETSLCCPGRASLLTGLHTHNHGVVVNDARLFHPAEHIGREMQSAGYVSMWVGKYLNKNNLLTEAQWKAHGAGWTHLDAIRSVGSGFYDYRLHTKSGTIKYGAYHSTRMAAERTVMHMRSAPADKPIFAVVSVFNVHGPNYPMPEFKNDPRCTDMPPWKPPNYNEADVADKPAVIQALPLVLYPDGWPMVRYCRELLGVDWAVKLVTDELAAEGRLENTLLVFTADNGVGWGAHRIGQHKSMPYTTPVPLYVSWPARWGAGSRTITEVVSNIDLAPTFCALGGCELDAYANGQTHADGVDLMPLLDGAVADLGRDAILESNWETGRTWTALRTTHANSLGLWHYVEHATGARELYDLDADPWEMENIAGAPAVAHIESALATRLAGLAIENARARVDVSVARETSGPYKGEGIYRDVVVRKQTIKRTGLSAGKSYHFTVRVRNRGLPYDSITLDADSWGSEKISVSYEVNGIEVTSAVNDGSYASAPVKLGSVVQLRVTFTIGGAAPAGARRVVVVRAASAADPARVDVVKAVVIR